MFQICLDRNKLRLKFSETYPILYSRVGDPMRIFKIKRNDTAPSIQATLIDENDVPIELTLLNNIKFIMKESFFISSEEEELKVQDTENVSLDAQESGKFQYNWQDGDTDTVSEYVAEFQITLNGHQAQNFALYNMDDGQVLDFSIDGGVTQSVTFLDADFAITNEATAAEIVAAINAVIVGGLATVTKEGNGVVIQTLTTDLTGSVQILGGTANSVFLFPTNLAQNSRISVPEKGLLVEILEDLDNQ